MVAKFELYFCIFIARKHSHKDRKYYTSMSSCFNILSTMCVVLDHAYNALFFVYVSLHIQCKIFFCFCVSYYLKSVRVIGPVFIYSNFFFLLLFSWRSQIQSDAVLRILNMHLFESLNVYL